MNEDDLVLTDAELGSALWMKLNKHFEQRLAAYRASNDQPADAIQTAHLRGKIAEVKAVLKLGAPDEE